MRYWTIHLLNAEGGNEYANVVAENIMAAIAWAKSQYKVGDDAIIYVNSEPVAVIK